MASKPIVIDPEFQQLLPAMPAESLKALESDILKDGCLHPLLVWAGHNILLDGHNRYDICKRHNIKFDVREISRETREDAFNFVIELALNKRNLTPEQQSYLRGKRYNNEKKAASGRSDRDLSGCQNDNPKKTHERIAEEYKVSPTTIICGASIRIWATAGR